MRLSNTLDVGRVVRDRRRGLGQTQADLARRAGVSRRWLSDLEAGKSTAEIGLVFRVFHALELMLETSPKTRGPDDIDLDELLNSMRTTNTDRDADNDDLTTTAR